MKQNVRPPPLFYKVNIFVIFVLKNTSKVITFYIINILIVKIIAHLGDITVSEGQNRRLPEYQNNIN
jgi:hypothetical protein